jgi:hypothetical protein
MPGGIFTTAADLLHVQQLIRPGEIGDTPFCG